MHTHSHFYPGRILVSFSIPPDFEGPQRVTMPREGRSWLETANWEWGVCVVKARRSGNIWSKFYQLYRTSSAIANTGRIMEDCFFLCCCSFVFFLCSLLRHHLHPQIRKSTRVNFGELCIVCLISIQFFKSFSFSKICSCFHNQYHWYNLQNLSS